MKSSDLVLLAVVAVGGYFLYKMFADQGIGNGGGAVMAVTPAAAPGVTTEFWGPGKIYITERGTGGQRAVVPLTPVGIAKAVVISKAIAASQEGRPITGFAQRLAARHGVELPHQMPFRTPIGVRGTYTAKILTVVAARRGL